MENLCSPGSKNLQGIKQRNVLLNKSQAKIVSWGLCPTLFLWPHSRQCFMALLTFFLNYLMAEIQKWGSLQYINIYIYIYIHTHTYIYTYIYMKRESVSHLVVSDSFWPHGLAHQVPLSIGFFRQEYWNREPFPSPRDLPNPGSESKSPALQADSLLSEPPIYIYHICTYIIILKIKSNSFWKKNYLANWFDKEDCLCQLDYMATFLINWMS